MENIINDLKKVINENTIRIEEKDVFDGEENYISTKVNLVMNDINETIVSLEDVLSIVFDQRLKVDFY